MHKAWCCLEEVPYCFHCHSSNFKVTRLKTSILTQIGRFRTVTLVWIHQWLQNDAQNFEWHRRGALLFFKVIRQISRSHDWKKSLIFTQIGGGGGGGGGGEYGGPLRPTAYLILIKSLTWMFLSNKITISVNAGMFLWYMSPKLIIVIEINISNHTSLTCVDWLKRHSMPATSSP